MHLQTTSPESKFPNEYMHEIFIQIDQHLKKVIAKIQRVPILWNTVYITSVMGMCQVCIANWVASASEWHVWLAPVCQSFQFIW